MPRDGWSVVPFCGERVGMFSRFKQTVGEKTGRADKTEYPVDYVQDCKYAEDTKQHTEKFVDKARAYNQAYGSLSGQNKIESMADPASALSMKLSSCSPSYSKTLQQMAEVQKKLGALQKQFQKDVDERVLDVLSEWMQTEYDLLKRERSKLEARRKEMDAAIHKAKSKDDDVTREKLELATGAHNDQLSNIQNLLKHLPDAQKKHNDLMKTFLKLQMAHHQRCTDAVTAFVNRC